MIRKLLMFSLVMMGIGSVMSMVGEVTLAKVGVVSLVYFIGCLAVIVSSWKEEDL